jgi:uncharacterized protein (TIGR00290 family)
MRPQAWMSWSSGKDSAMALHEARSAGQTDVTGLVTTVTTGGRVAVHDVRRELLEAQAAALGLPLHVVELPWPCPNAVYEELTRRAWAVARQQDVSQVIFGDLYLADIRAYREASLAGTGMTPVFPLWARPTGAVAAGIVACGIRALIACVDLAQAPDSLAGRWYDQELLSGLPPGVDPCGENGEFHTFVTDGPGFSRPVPVSVAGTTARDGFMFTDLALAS